MRVVLVEDDPVAAHATRRGLEGAGHAVDVAPTGAEGLWLVAEVEPDVVIVDGVLPDLDGLEVCQRLRADAYDGPILMLTARGEVADRVAGLDAGADDYLPKPVAVDELLARLRAVGRRAAGRRPTVLRIGDLEVDPAARQAVRAGRPLDLTTKELSLLLVLAEAGGAVVERRRLLAALWDFASDPDPNVLDVHVRNLRAKLDRPFPTPLVHTVRGVGYRLADLGGGQQGDG